ncbi:MAG TPA: hypothetical protein VGR52_10620 [Stellaceae bacterium]|nr:hypothetical protein [Stellaceae bacterium]
MQELLGKPFAGYRSACRSHPHAIVLQQPNHEVLAAISEFEPRHIVSRCDVAIDLITATQDDARALNEFLAFHVIMPWRGTRCRRIVRIATYYGPPHTGRNLAIYPDRPSKVDGRPACHVELRLDRARTCKTHGINRLSDVDHLDPNALVARNMRLAVLPPQRLRRLLDRITCEQMRKGRYDRATTDALVCNFVARGCLQDETFWPGGDWSRTTPVQLYIDRVKSATAWFKTRIDLRTAVISFSAAELCGCCATNAKQPCLSGTHPGYVPNTLFRKPLFRP